MIVSPEWGSAGNDSEEITLNGTALGLTTAKILPVTASQSRILICPKDGNITYLKNGSNPTTTTGMPLSTGDIRIFTAPEAAALKMINVSGAVKVEVEYSYR